MTQAFELVAAAGWVARIKRAMTKVGRAMTMASTFLPFRHAPRMRGIQQAFELIALPDGSPGRAGR